METKFKAGDFAIYINKNELVEIKEVIVTEVPQRRHQRQDGLQGEPSGPEEIKLKVMYRIYTHTGETSAMCDETYLAQIPNAYAFKIRRLSAEETKMNYNAALAFDRLNAEIYGYTNTYLASYAGGDTNAYIYEGAEVEYEDSIMFQIIKFLRELMYGKHQ